MGAESTRVTRAQGKRLMGETECTAARNSAEQAGSMRGHTGPHGKKKHKTGESEQEEWETGEQGAEVERAAPSKQEQNSQEEEQATAVESMADAGIMRGKGTGIKEMHMAARCSGTCEDDEQNEEGHLQSTEIGAQREQDGEVHATAAQRWSEGPTRPTQARSLRKPEGNVNRPKRMNRGQPEYFPEAKKRKRTTGEGSTSRNKTRIRYVDSRGGKGRVALAHTIVVGQVCVQRTARGDDRRDAGRPPREPG